MTEKILREIVLFKNCEDSFFTKIASYSNVKSFEKGQMLFLHGENAEYFYYIKNGWVKLFRETLDGTQAVVDILTKGHIFGDTSIFEDGAYPYSAEVVESSTLITLPLSKLKEEIENNAKFAYDMLSAMAKYRRQQDREIEHLSIQNAAQRIGCFLLRLCTQEEKENIDIQLPYDKMLVASRLGMQPETFSRALKKLKNETDIEILGSVIRMKNLDQITRYCCSACSSDFPCKDIVKAAE